MKSYTMARGRDSSVLTLVAVRTLSNAIDIVDAAFTVGVLAHEVDCWQIELPSARLQVARLLVVEVDGSALHLGNLVLAVADLVHLFVLACLMLVDALLLRLKVLEHEGLEDAEAQVRVPLQDLQYKQRRKDVLLTDLAQGFDQKLIVALVVGISLVAEVGQRLDPHVAIDWLILENKCIALADLKHLGRVFLLNVEVEQLVLQVLVCLATVDDTFLAAIDLEQEEHIVLVDFAAVVALDEFIDGSLHLKHLVKEARLCRVILVSRTLALDFSVDPLFLDEVALKEPIVELYLGQAL